MKAYIDCVGCEQRQLDSQRVINYLKENDATITDNPALADYVFVITCAVDSKSEEESKRRIKEVAGRMGKQSKLVIGGCLPSISPNALSSYNVYHTFSPRSIDSLDKVLNLGSPISDVSASNQSIFDEQNCTTHEISPREKFEHAKNGYKVVIAQGCLGACSYCMIKEATGYLESIPLEVVLNQIKTGSDNGEKTVMLMAGDTGAYGRDIGTNLATLLREATLIPGDFKIYIHDFGVNWLIKDLDEYLSLFESAEKTNKIGGITFPIQSGSDRVLKLMNRRYNRKDAIHSLESIRGFSFYIGTHIMVGFPSESDHDFQETLDLLAKVKFDFITCFPYSEHPRAESAMIEGKVANVVVKERLKIISEKLGNKIKVVK